MPVTSYCLSPYLMPEYRRQKISKTGYPWELELSLSAFKVNSIAKKDYLSFKNSNRYVKKICAE